MSETKRKISVRKVLQAIVTVIVLGGGVAAMLGASSRQKEARIHDIRLEVRNGQQYMFLDKDALWKQLIDQKDIVKNVTRVDQVNVRDIEAEARENPWVSQAEAYVDNNKDLHIYVTQRRPAARVFFENGQSFYLDASAKLLPLSDMFTYYTTIVTNVPVFSNDSLDNDIRNKILKLVTLIDRDTFWSAQIAQVIVTPDHKFELIPVLGNHTIILGDTTDMKIKLDNLFAFYKNVLNRIGWDKYERLDLRFSNQVVASPNIPWKPSSKNAISNMDWVKNIMEQVRPDTGAIAVAAPKPVVAAKPAAAVVKTPVSKPVASAAKTPVSKPAASKPKPTVVKPATVKP
ncbi:MAG: hypothetical protein EOP49_13695, partial [Sphingobacteriales bacterium]